MSDTTTRYKANSNINLDAYSIKEDDLYQFGCEFEFYIDTDKYEIQEVVKIIKTKISTFCDVDILVDLVNLPVNIDKNYCVQIKPDQSLEDNGIEITIPITSQSGVKYYIENILPLVEEYGYTNEDTGLHFHISTINTDGVNFNFYLYMLMCHDNNLLSSWQPRIGYSQNVMDILSKCTKSKAREVKSKKGTIWNLEKLAVNHIEIKSIGGIDYHKEMGKIIDEFNMYVKYFDCICRDTEPKYRQKLVDTHKEIIKSIDLSTKEEFSKAVIEAGLIK